MSFQIDKQTIVFPDNYQYTKIVGEYNYHSFYYTIDYKSTSKQLLFTKSIHSIYDYSLFNQYDWDTREIYINEGLSFIDTEIYNQEDTSIYLYLYAKMMHYIKIHEISIINHINLIPFNPNYFIEDINLLINQIYIINTSDNHLLYYLKHETNYFNYKDNSYWHPFMLYSYFLSYYYFTRFIQYNHSFKQLLNFMIAYPGPYYIENLTETIQCLLLLLLDKNVNRKSKKEKKIIQLITKHIKSKYESIDSYFYEVYQLTDKQLSVIKNRIK